MVGALLLAPIVGVLSKHCKLPSWHRSTWTDNNEVQSPHKARATAPSWGGQRLDMAMNVYRSHETFLPGKRELIHWQESQRPWLTHPNSLGLFRSSFFIPPANSLACSAADKQPNGRGMSEELAPSALSRSVYYPHLGTRENDKKPTMNQKQHCGMYWE